MAKWPKVGDVFVQADLAAACGRSRRRKQNARHGRHAALMAARDYFYRGRLGNGLALHADARGLLAASDLAGWHATVGVAAKGEYRGYEIYKTGFWARDR